MRVPHFAVVTRELIFGVEVDMHPVLLEEYVLVVKARADKVARLHCHESSVLQTGNKGCSYWLCNNNNYYIGLPVVLPVIINV